MKNVARTSHRLEPLHLVFSFLGGLVLLFIVAPLAGMVLKTSVPEVVATAVDPEVQRSVTLTLWHDGSHDAPENMARDSALLERAALGEWPGTVLRLFTFAPAGITLGRAQ